MTVGALEILLVLFFVLLIIGPRRVANLGRSLGRGASVRKDRSEDQARDPHDRDADEERPSDGTEAGRQSVDESGGPNEGQTGKERQQGSQYSDGHGRRDQ